MVGMNAESASNPGLHYVVLLCVLGVLIGAAFECLLTPYMEWVRRNKPHALARMWLFMFVVLALPVFMIVGVFAGLEPGLASDQTEASLYILAFCAGLTVARVVRLFVRRRRRRTN